MRRGKPGDLEKYGRQAADPSLALRRLRISAVMRSVFVLLGALVVQFLAALLCRAGYAGYCVFVRRGAALSPSAWKEMMEGHLGDFSMLISLSYAVIVIIWCGILYHRWQWRVRPFSYRKALGGARIPALAGLGFGACVVLTYLVSAAAVLFPSAFTAYQELMESLTMNSSIWTIPYVILLGPMAEELLFRGVIMDRLRPAFSFWPANILQAALFGLYHGNVIQGLYAFCFGMILGLIVQVTGTVCAPMMTHVIFNGTSEVFGLLAAEDPAVAGLAGIVLVAAVICFVAGLRYYSKRIVTKGEDQDEKA